MREPFLLACSCDDEQIAEAFRLGARGVVLRDSATNVLVQGLRTVMAGGFWVGSDPVDGEIGNKIRTLAEASANKIHPQNFGLTKREREVVRAIVAGASNKEIATKFSISGDTVKHHLSNIFDKLGLYNRLELALFAIQHRLIDDL